MVRCGKTQGETVTYQDSWWRARAVAAVEAATPHIAAAERDKIRQQLARHRFHDECIRGDDCPNIYHVTVVLPPER